jgi:pimeloyl-ACP methyl ester carboxylesterase
MEIAESADGTTIAFERTGDGPPLILVGGAFNDPASASMQASLLAPNFTVYAYDRRGRGDSGDVAPYAVERELEDLGALIEAAGGPVFVYGHSSGAILAIEAAAAGLPFEMMAVYEPPYVDDTRQALGPDMADRLRALVAADQRSEAVKVFLLEAVLAPPEAVAAVQAGPMWPALEALAHTLAYDMEIVGVGELPAGRLATIGIPTLAMDGGASPGWAHNAVRAVAEALPNSKHVTIEGQDHAVDPALVAPLLVDFFA